MAKFIFVYHGGKMPETEQEGAAVMAAWHTWLDGLGATVVDGGNPVGLSSTVNSDGSISDHGGSNPTSGYSLISADNMQDALNIAKGCPILQADGSVEVAETIEM